RGWQHLVMPFLNLPFVRGVPGSVLPLCPWHWLVLLHQVSCPEEVTPSIIDHKVYFTFLSELEK
ncbi:hypothetical protein, partial [Bacillus safensis]|uniref:hypothetical protein n=1 Tax=Bacillus safensis TaxID=561879 RepID=UPI002E1F974F|nr:hypothetical protein [Bacillus safensis]